MPIISIPGLVGKEGHTKCVLTPSLSLTDHPLSLEIIFMFFFSAENNWQNNDLLRTELNPRRP